MPSDSTWYAGWSHGSGVVSDWTPAAFDVAYASGSQVAALSLESQSDLAAGGGRIDRFIRIRNVHVYGRWGDAEKTLAAVNISLADIFGDLATAMGATSQRIADGFTHYYPSQFVVRYPCTVADVLRTAEDHYAAPMEAFFDLDPATLERRFTARARPADTALVDNRLWVIGGRGGEHVRPHPRLGGDAVSDRRHLRLSG